MAVKRVFVLVRHLVRGELGSLLKDCSDPVLARRLLFICHLYDGDSVLVAASKVRMVKNSGYIWAYRWNDKGVKGLLDLPRSGRPSLLGDEQKKELKELLDLRDDWSTREVRGIIEEDYGVSITENGVYRMLRGWGMYLCKPFVKDYRRPLDAEEVLKKGSKKPYKKGGLRVTG